VAGEVLQVDNVASLLAGCSQGSHAQRVNRDVGIELQPSNVDCNQLLNNATREWHRNKSSLTVPSGSRQRPEHRSGGVVADSGSVEPGFHALGRLGVQRHLALLSAFAVDFKNLVDTHRLVAADFQPRQFASDFGVVVRINFAKIGAQSGRWPLSGQGLGDAQDEGQPPDS
jgi:hypothetical protein